MKTETKEIKQEDKAITSSSSVMKKIKAEGSGKKPCLSWSDKQPSRARKRVKRAQAASSASDCDFYHVLLRVSVSRGLGKAVTGRQLRDKFWRDTRTR